MEAVILALGSINADFQVRIDKPAGSAGLALAHDFRRLGGGKAANVAFLARRLGRAARLFGRVGDDDLAAQALTPLREVGVDLSEVCRAGGQTGFAMVLVPRSGKKNIVVAANANDEWSDEEIGKVCHGIELAPAGSVLVCNCEIPARVVKAAAGCARRHGMHVVLDPTFPDRVDDELLAMADVITPNEEEAHQLAGAGAICDIARALAARGPRVVCIKLDGGGCLLLVGKQEQRVASVDVEVVDTTGAGDAFTGAFAVALLEGRAPPEAARFAVAASTAAVMAYGAQPSYPDRSAVMALMPGEEERSSR